MSTILAVPLAGDLERFLSEDLYPYRYEVTAVATVIAVIALIVAYRLRVHVWLWERRLFTGPAIMIFLAVFIPVSYFLLSPLWERSLVCEASPIPGTGAGSDECDDDGAIAATNPSDAQPTLVPTDGGGAPPPDPIDAPADPTSESDAPAVDFEPQVVRQGTFVGADEFHFGEGSALLIETAPDTYVLRFEEFSVRNGPDLFVYLSPNPDGYADGALKLGELKGTDGAFNYEVPPGTDVSQFESAVVWCDAFAVLFSTASFE